MELSDMSSEARELCLWFDNDEPAYRAYYLPAAQMLQRHWQKGEFTLDRGIVGMTYATTSAAKRYHLEHGSMSTKWSSVFSVKDRQQVAEYMVEHLVDEWRAGNFFGEHWEWDIRGRYGREWEDLCTETTLKEANARLREYRENEPGTPVKVVRRLVKG